MNMELNFPFQSKRETIGISAVFDFVWFSHLPTAAKQPDMLFLDNMSTKQWFRQCLQCLQ